MLPMPPPRPPANWDPVALCFLHDGGGHSIARKETPTVAAKRPPPVPPPRPPEFVGGQNVNGIDLFAEAWGEPVADLEPERGLAPTPETPDYQQLNLTGQGVDEPGETATTTKELPDAPTAQAPTAEAPDNQALEPDLDTKSPAPEPELELEPEPVPEPEPEVQPNSAEVELNGDATPTMDRSLQTNGAAPTDHAGDAVEIAGGHAAADAQASGTSADFEASAEPDAAPEAPLSSPDLAELDDIRLTELHSASEPVPATLTPTQEAHEILGAKGKNQTEAMDAAKQKRAAKRAARAEQATLDDPVAVEEALVI
jgi:hypothetical protein